MFGYHGDLLVPSFETAGLGPETDHLSPSVDMLSHVDTDFKNIAARIIERDKGLCISESIWTNFKDFVAAMESNTFQSETSKLKHSNGYASKRIKAACNWAYKGVTNDSVLRDDFLYMHLVGVWSSSFAKRKSFAPAESAAARNVHLQCSSELAMVDRGYRQCRNLVTFYLFVLHKWKMWLQQRTLGHICAFRKDLDHREVIYDDIKRIEKGMRRQFHNDITVLILYLDHDQGWSIRAVKCLAQIEKFQNEITEFGTKIYSKSNHGVDADINFNISDYQEDMNQKILCTYYIVVAMGFGGEAQSTKVCWGTNVTDMKPEWCLFLARSTWFQKAQLFDFDLTLPIIAAEFLFFMFILDKLYYSPLDKFMDKCDSEIKERLNSVKDTSIEVKQLEDQPAAVMRVARAEISAALNQMKKETATEVDVKLVKGRKAELQEALLNLEKQKENTIKSLDS
ncbi:hypothetical protein Tco_0033099 [Tanacetum coccineum]